MVDINHRIGIKSPIENVYKALTSIEGLSGWWTKEATGDANQGGKIEFVFKSPEGELKGKMVMEVTAHEFNKKIQWRCLEGPAEWIGTDIRFELKQEGEMTIVLFSHLNWKEVVEMTYHCSMKWAVFLLSLRDFVMTGRGQPSPGDLKIDNWN